jgi:hypothetical protein
VFPPGSLCHDSPAARHRLRGHASHSLAGHRDVHRATPQGARTRDETRVCLGT